LANPRNQRLRFIAAFMLVAALYGCGGGGADSGNVFPSKTLSWSPPTTFSDSTPLDPARDLNLYEVYVNETGTFSDTSSPMAEVVAVEPGTGKLGNTFDLANLSSYLSPGVTYHVSIRAVSISGLKSAFSGSATFSF